MRLATCALGAGLGALICPSAAAAQTQADAAVAPADADALEEIVVTAQRRPERLQETPISITAITAATIAQRDLRDVRDISRIAPNLIVTNGPQGGDDANFFIRGVGQTEFIATTDPGVGVYVDGVYLGRTQGAALDLLDLERVEVLRGPQGTLFGRNTIGGAVSLITRQPDPDELEGFVGATVGQRDRYEGRASINLPLSDIAAVRVSVIGRHQDGYGVRVVDGRRMGNVRTLAGRVALRIEPTPAFTIIGTLDGTRGRGTSAHNINASARPGMRTPLGFPVPADINIDSSPDRDLSFVSVEPFNDLDLWGTSLTLEYDFGPFATVRSISAYRTFDQLTGADFDATRYVASDQVAATDQRQFSQELQLTGSAFKQLTYVVGAYYFDEKITQVTNAALAPARPRLDPNTIRNQRTNRPRNKSFALYAQLGLEVIDDLTLTLGGRYTKDNKTFFNETILDNSDRTVPFLPPTRFLAFSAENVKESFSKFTPRVALDYKPTRDVLLYASFSRGFKSGGFNGRPANAAALTTYDPETVTSYEIGAKTELLDRRLRLNVAAFTSDYKDIQLTGLINGVFQLANAGTARIRGVEVEATAQPLPGLRLDANLGYQHNEYRSIRAGAIIPGVTLDAKLPNTPEFTAAVGAEYGFDIGTGRLTARADHTYKSAFFFQASNAPGDREGAYGLTDFRVAYTANAGWQVAGFVKNAFDTEYNINGQDARGQVGYFYLYPGPPREWGASVSYRF